MTAPLSRRFAGFAIALLLAGVVSLPEGPDVGAASTPIAANAVTNPSPLAATAPRQVTLAAAKKKKKTSSKKKTVVSGSSKTAASLSPSAVRARATLIETYVTSLTPSVAVKFAYKKGLCGSTVCGNVSFVARSDAKLEAFVTPTMNLDTKTGKYASATKMTKLGRVVLAHETGHVAQAKLAQLRFDGLNGLLTWLRANGFSGSGRLPLEKSADAMAYAKTGQVLGAYLKKKPTKTQLAAAKQLWIWAAE